MKVTGEKSRIRIQILFLRYGSGDQDPYQIVKNPENWSVRLYTVYFTRGKNFIVLSFIVATNITKLKIILFLNRKRKTFEPI